MIVDQNRDSFGQIAQIIARGGVIAFRTDTFYGLGADPFNASAMRKIKRLKGREEHKPILVLISDRAYLHRLIPRTRPSFEQLSEQFWPGALTIIGEAASDAPDDLTAATKTLGVRLPDDDNVRALVESCGGMLTATSANPSGLLPARTAQDVERYFADELDLIVDGGAANTDQPSTVISATGGEIKLIREGAVPWAQIRFALGLS